METFVAKTLQGLEEVLANELKQIGADNVTIGRRAVTFDGTLETLYKANVHSRTALRILRPIATFKASSTDQLYAGAKAIQWENYIALLWMNLKPIWISVQLISKQER